MMLPHQCLLETRASVCRNLCSSTFEKEGWLTRVAAHRPIRSFPQTFKILHSPGTHNRHIVLDEGEKNPFLLRLVKEWQICFLVSTVCHSYTYNTFDCGRKRCFFGPSCWLLFRPASCANRTSSNLLQHVESGSLILWYYTLSGCIGLCGNILPSDFIRRIFWQGLAWIKTGSQLIPSFFAALTCTLHKCPVEP